MKCIVVFVLNYKGDKLVVVELVQVQLDKNERIIYITAIIKILNQLVLSLEINPGLSILTHSLVAINTVVIYPKQEKK